MDHWAEIIKKQRDFFSQGKTKDFSFRLNQLKLLKKIISTYERDIYEALFVDLKRPSLETYVAEIAPIIKEIEFFQKNLKILQKPKKVRTPLAFLPGKSYIYREPYGVVLVIAPWNYPFQLTFIPLVGALAGGNCVILKPSEYAPASAQLISKLIGDHFAQQHMAVAEGGKEVAEKLLNNRFDYIFFTGNRAVGEKILTAAAKYLTPVTLELGGKCPCIVDVKIDLDVTARRIVWGKFFNAGQTCIAVDYLLVHGVVKEALSELKEYYIGKFVGEKPQESPDFGRIVNKSHFGRLCRLLKKGKIIIGGEIDEENLYIAPTLIDEVAFDFPIMQEEIFGPLLPVMTYEHLEEAITLINSLPSPLALYLFSLDEEKGEYVRQRTSSGAIVINDVMLHQPSPYLPFGGIGQSGAGRYHGEASFATFTYQRSVLKRPFSLDLMLRYPPYRNHLKYVKKLF